MKPFTKNLHDRNHRFSAPESKNVPKSSGDRIGSRTPVRQKAFKEMEAEIAVMVGLSTDVPDCDKCVPYHPVGICAPMQPIGSCINCGKSEIECFKGSGIGLGKQSNKLNLDV